MKIKWQGGEVGPRLPCGSHAVSLIPNCQRSLPISFAQNHERAVASFGFNFNKPPLSCQGVHEKFHENIQRKNKGLRGQPMQDGSACERSERSYASEVPREFPPSGPECVCREAVSHKGSPRDKGGRRGSKTRARQGLSFAPEARRRSGVPPWMRDGPWCASRLRVESEEQRGFAGRLAGQQRDTQMCPPRGSAHSQPVVPVPPWMRDGPWLLRTRVEARRAPRVSLRARLSVKKR